MGRPNRRRESSRIRKTIGNGRKMQAMLRGLLSARRRLGKPFQFCARRLKKYIGRGIQFARGPETSVCKQSLLRDLNLHSSSSSMEWDARRRHHTASSGCPQKSASWTRRSCSTGPNRPQRYRPRYRRSSGTDADENCSSKLVTPSEEPICYRRRKHQNQVSQIPQRLPLRTVSTDDQSMMEKRRLLIDIGQQECTSQPPQFVKLLQSVSNCESSEGSARKKDGPWVRGVVHIPDRKIPPVYVKCRCQFLDIQNQQPEADITNFPTLASWNLLCDKIQVMRRDMELHEKKSNRTIEILQSKVKQLEKHKQRSAISGSYAEGSPTPALLDNAFFDTKTAVTSLQKCFAHEGIKSKGCPASVMSLLNSDSPGRTHHVQYAFRAIVNQVFFEGFENESFNTICGVAKFVDPDIRQAKFYGYYRQEQEQHYAHIIEDPQYKEFVHMKHEDLCAKLNLRCESEEDLGGPQLASRFKAAARSVWLLHKLAFSFEPPANIFRVERGADMNRDYMEHVEDLEDCKSFVPKVGFMVAPGLRLRKTVVRCQVHIS